MEEQKEAHATLHWHLQGTRGSHAAPRTARGGSSWLPHSSPGFPPGNSPTAPQVESAVILGSLTSQRRCSSPCSSNLKPIQQSALHLCPALQVPSCCSRASQLSVSLRGAELRSANQCPPRPTRSGKPGCQWRNAGYSSRFTSRVEASTRTPAIVPLADQTRAQATVPGSAEYWQTHGWNRRLLVLVK